VRVPVEITAWIRAGGQRRVGVVTSLSRRGAFIETSDAYQINQPIRLEFKTDDSWVRIFANVSYQEVYDDSDDASMASGIGVIFYEVDRDTEDEISVIIEQVWSRHLP